MAGRFVPDAPSRKPAFPAASRTRTGAAGFLLLQMVTGETGLAPPTVRTSRFNRSPAPLDRAVRVREGLAGCGGPFSPPQLEEEQLRFLPLVRMTGGDRCSIRETTHRSVPSCSQSLWRRATLQRLEAVWKDRQRQMHWIAARRRHATLRYGFHAPLATVRRAPELTRSPIVRTVQPRSVGSTRNACNKSAISPNRPL